MMNIEDKGQFIDSFLQNSLYFDLASAFYAFVSLNGQE